MNNNIINIHTHTHAYTCAHMTFDTTVSDSLLIQIEVNQWLNNPQQFDQSIADIVGYKGAKSAENLKSAANAWLVHIHGILKSVSLNR